MTREGQVSTLLSDQIGCTVVWKLISASSTGVVALLSCALLLQQQMELSGTSMYILFGHLVLRTSFMDGPKAHTLLAFAERDAGREAQNKLQEILFRHYFTDGRYPDEGNLRAAAVEAGLDPERAMAAVADQGRTKINSL